MNTLPQAITAQLLGNPSHFDTLRRHWSALMRSPRKHDLKAAHHLVYLALIGKDWRRGFAPMTSRRKLDNGAFSGWMLFKALAALHTTAFEDFLLAPFDGLVTAQMLQQLRQLIPFRGPSKYQPDQFTAGFPFDAYTPLSTLQPAAPADGETHA
jgi:hypothetical protein